MKIKLNYRDPDSGEKCTRIELHSFGSAKETRNERLIEMNNVFIKKRFTDRHRDIYTDSFEEELTLCQREPQQPSSIQVRIKTEKRKRKNSKKVEISEKIEKMDLFGQEFDKEWALIKKKHGDAVF